MFGVGLHFSLKDLLAVRTIAVPGAIAQIAVASGLGIALGLSLGWSFAGSAIFGLALSVASTVVLLRALQARDMVETEIGRAHVCTPVTNAQLVCRLLLANKPHHISTYHSKLTH